MTGCWRDLDQAVGSIELHRAHILIVAKRLLPADSATNRILARPLEHRFGGRLILILEPQDEFRSKEFAGLDVEGLILSSATIAELTDCITSVRQGRCWVDPGIRAVLSHGPQRATEGHDLSSRETEVARLAAAGLSNKYIARELGVSDGTVKMHMHHILAKLRLTSRIDLVGSLQQSGQGRSGADLQQSARYIYPDSNLTDADIS